MFVSPQAINLCVGGCMHTCMCVYIVQIHWHINVINITTICHIKWKFEKEITIFLSPKNAIPFSLPGWCSKVKAVATSQIENKIRFNFLEIWWWISRSLIKTKIANEHTAILWSTSSLQHMHPPLYAGEIWGLFYKSCMIPLLINIIQPGKYICKFLIVSGPSIA